MIDAGNFLLIYSAHLKAYLALVQERRASYINSVSSDAGKKEKNKNQILLRFLWTYFPAFARFWVRTMGARVSSYR
nr:hypothetical protein Q903MT_gene6562 [Picea sitchensis]